jgi:2'-5' RNA ligase
MMVSVAAELGQTGVVVPVPAADPIVAAWRAQFDSSAAEGMPAHITALCPFLAPGRLTDSVMARLLGVCAELPAQEIAFRRTGRFPGVLYLEPEPADSLRRLTTAIAEEWPETHPYGGAFDDVIPHLTIAQDVDDAVLADIEDDVLRALPVQTRLEEACLYVFDGARWQPQARLPFQG